MKRILIIAIMLTLGMCLLSCGKASEGAQASDTVQESDTQTATEKATDTAEDTSAPDTEEYIPSRKIKIACVGDSITYGLKATNVTLKSYPAQLKALIGNKNCIIQNYGRSSSYMINPKDYPDFKLASANSIAYTATNEYQNSLSFKADIVVICLGANDAYVSNTNANIDQVKYFYESAVKLAKTYQDLESKPTVYFMYPPARFDAQYRLDYIKNTIIPQIDLAANECGCEVIDLFSLTEEYARKKNTTYIDSDGVHLADKGYGVMAKAVYDAIADYRLPEDR